VDTGWDEGLRWNPAGCCVSEALFSRTNEHSALSGVGSSSAGANHPNVRIEGALFAELVWMSSWKPLKGHLLKRKKTRRKHLR
jgi:hypothetical protein